MCIANVADWCFAVCSARNFCRSGAAVLVLAFALLPPFAAAQTTGTIYGTVTDPSGAVVPGARLVATQVSTGLTREATSDEAGSYTFTVMSIGAYTVSAQKVGFQKAVVNAELLLNQNLRINLQLTVGTVGQAVEVSSGSSLIELESPALGNVVSDKTIQDLPLSDRNFLQLAQFQPGVNPPIPGTANLGTPSTPGASAFSPQANGVRPWDDLVLIDGTYDIEPSLNTVMLVPNPEALSELKVYTGDYEAEFGGAGGVVTNVVTRSGGNQFHGAAFIFEQNDALNARNFFAPIREPQKRHDFGGTFGGPLIKNKTFFFLSYEGVRDSRRQVSVASVPSTAELGGNFNGDPVQPIDPTTGLPFPGNTIPITSMSPVALAIVKGNLFAPPNDGPNTWVGLLNSPSTDDQFLVRLDQNLSATDTLNFRYLYDNTNFAQPIQPFAIFGSIATPGFGVTDAAQFQNFEITETHLFGPTLINKAMFAYIRAVTVFNQPDNTVNARAFGFTYPIVTNPLVSGGFPYFPELGISGFNAIGLNDSAPTYRTDNIFQFEDDVTKSFGPHEIQFGASVRRIQMNSQYFTTFPGAFGFYGTASGNPTADFLLGLPTEFFQGGGSAKRYFRTTYFSGYGQDRWKLSNRVTLSLGLRYDLFTPATELHNTMATLVKGEQSVVHPQAPLGVVYPGDPGISKGIYPTQKNNWAPRIGLVWDPVGDGKTSIRAAYGIYYSQPILYGNIDGTTTPGFWDTLEVFSPPFADPYSGNSPYLENPLPFTPPPGIEQIVSGWLPRQRTPYIEQWNLTIQRQLASDFVAQLSYVGSQGHHLVGFNSPTQALLFVPGIPNTPSTIPLRSPFPGIGLSDLSSTIFNSNYNGLQASITKRASHGIVFTAAYTWSKMIDDNSAANRFQVIPGAALYAQDSRNLKAERAESNFDVPSRFIGTFSWEVPGAQHLESTAARKILGGWQLNGIITAQSGRPVDIIDSADPQATGELFSRPNIICNPNLPPGQRTAAMWFDTACFVAVPFGTPMFGDAPRNDVSGPGLFTVDFSVFKNTKIGERINTQFQFEFFNLFNHTNFQVPTNDISSALFGQITSTATTPRNMQVAFKLMF
jgi:outer membrane receptor protein involved in Fe transport